jgi:hypothetical protein
VESQVEVTARGAIIRYRGPVTSQGIQEAAHAMADHESFLPSMPAIWDFSAAQGNGLDADEMRRLAQALKPLREGGSRPRVAIVTPDDANFGAARMFGGLNEARLLVEIGVFRSAAEARSWAFGGGDAAAQEPPEGPPPG